MKIQTCTKISRLEKSALIVQINSSKVGAYLHPKKPYSKSKHTRKIKIDQVSFEQFLNTEY